jgi:hypothetical protein
MSPKALAVSAAALTSILLACQDRAKAPATPAPTPQATATVVKVIEVPTPAPSSTAPASVEVMQQPTPCGAEKLQNYLNLIPTKTASEEIAKTLGHNRIRYVSLKDAKTSASKTSQRVTAGLGVDGRIKLFNCG